MNTTLIARPGTASPVSDTSKKQARFCAVARELGYSVSDIQGATTYRYGVTSDGKHHTTFTASVASGTPETRIQEIAHAVALHMELQHGAGASVELI